MYQHTKSVLVRWNEDLSNGQPLYYDMKDYEAMSQLAIWLVQKNCEINGTEVPQITALWGVCFEAQGVGSLKEAGLAL